MRPPSRTGGRPAESREHRGVAGLLVSVANTMNEGGEVLYYVTQLQPFTCEVSSHTANE